MGCCCRKSKELQELESELERLISQKRSLESRLSSHKHEESEQSTSDTTSELLKFVDQDQYLTLKVFETLFSVASTDPQAYQSFNQRYQTLNSLQVSENLLNYAQLRVQESELQKKLAFKLQEQFKDLSEFTALKICTLEERIEKIEALFGDSEDLTEDREWVKDKLKEVQSSGKLDLEGIVKGLKVLEEVQKKIEGVEGMMPKMQTEDFFVLKLKEMESNLAALGKNSLACLNSLSSVFGEASEKVDVSGLKSAEIDLQTFTRLFTSVSDRLKDLQDLETRKIEQIQAAPIVEKLKSIEKLLTRYLVSSEQHKSVTQARLKRVGRSSNEVNHTARSIFQGLNQTKKTVSNAIQSLESKVSSFLDSLQAQDQLLLETTEKINSIDKIIDEIEIRFQEFLSTEIKNIYKLVNTSNPIMKQALDEVNEKLIEYNEQVHQDLVERLEFFLTKVKITETLETIKSQLRDTQSKDLSKAKLELQERINDLSSQVSTLESEKSHLNNSLSSIKSQLSAASELTETLFKSVNEKELFVTELKNSIATLQEQLDLNLQDKNKLEDEVSDLQKELRDCKKTLRTKEHELAELKEQLINPN